MFWVDLTYAIVFCVFTFIFLFRTNVRKRYLDESNFCCCYGNFFESSVLKVTWSQLYSNLFLNNCEGTLTTTFERHLTLKILRTWFKIRGNSFIKTWVNITLHLKEYCTKVDERSLIVICVFFPKANLVFKSNPVFIDILDSFCHSYLHFCLLIIDILWSLNFIQCLYAFFYKKK